MFLSDNSRQQEKHFFHGRMKQDDSPCFSDFTLAVSQILTMGLFQKERTTLKRLGPWASQHWKQRCPGQHLLINESEASYVTFGIYSRCPSSMLGFTASSVPQQEEGHDDICSGHFPKSMLIFVVFGRIYSLLQRNYYSYTKLKHLRNIQCTKRILL